MEEEKKEEAKKQDTKPVEKAEEKEIKSVEKKEEKKVQHKEASIEVKKETKKQEESKNQEKKFEKVKGEKKKSNKRGMMIGIIIAILVIVVILAYAFVKTDSPKQVVETMLSDLKSGNYSQGILTSVLQEEDFNQEAQKSLFNKLQWKVLNVKEEENKATVEVEITNKDFKTIIGNYMQRIIKTAFSGENPSEQEMTNYLIEELNKEEIQNVTSNQSILNKQ